MFGTVFLINVTCAKEFFPLNVTGTAVGILNTVMILSMDFFQGITGYFIDYFGAGATAAAAYQKVFMLYCVCTIIAIILVLFIPETFGWVRTEREDTGPGGG